jgi:hypothetical protein
MLMDERARTSEITTITHELLRQSNSSLLLARNGHPAAVLACQLVGEDRKWAAHAQIDVNDPKQTTVCRHVVFAPPAARKSTINLAKAP